MSESAAAATDMLSGAVSQPSSGPPPGPPPFPVVGWRGNVLRFFQDPISAMRRLRRDHGDVVGLVSVGNDPLFFQAGPRRLPTLFGFGPEINRQVLTQPHIFESDVMRGPEQFPWLVNNMATANREERTVQRRMIGSAFSRDHLKSYYPDMVSYSRKMLERWGQQPRFCLAREIENLAADVATKSLFGQEPEGDSHTIGEMAREIGKLLVSPITMLPINLPGAPYRRFIKLTRSAGEALLHEVERKKAAGVPGDDVLSVMLRAQNEDGGRKLDDGEIIGNAFATFFAGHDVPANAITFTLFLLSQHPEYLAEVLEELRPLDGEPPTFDEIWRAFPKLDRVIRESLRVLSPAVLVWRRATSDAQLGSFDVAAGSEVLISPFMTHTDPAVYDDPLRFNPHRWEKIRPTAYEFLPYSQGFRKCLGAAFAELLLKTVVSMIVQRFRFEIDGDPKLDFHCTFTVKLKHGLPVVARPQDHQLERSRARIRGTIRQLVDLD